MKKAFLLLFLLLPAVYATAQTAPALLESIHTGYMDIKRIHPGYIAALREGVLDIRQAAPDSLGTLTTSVVVSDVPAIGGYVETKGNIMYTIGGKLTPIDISTPTAPVMGTPVTLPPYLVSTCIWNDLLILSAQSRTYIYSISSPATPLLLDSVDVLLANMVSSGNRLYARQGNETYTYCWHLSATAPFLTPGDSVNLHSTVISITIANGQLLARNLDTLYRFDLNGTPDFQLRATKKLPDYTYNGRLTAIDTNHIGYSLYNSFWMSYGVPGNSFADSFSVLYCDYYLGSGRLDNSIFYSDVESTRLIGIDGAATGIQQHSTLPGLLVYPNPVSDVLHIRVPAADFYTYTLSDFGGRAFGAGKLTPQISAIDVSKLPAGSYLLQLQDEHRKRLQKR